MDIDQINGLIEAAIKAERHRIANAIEVAWIRVESTAPELNQFAEDLYREVLGEC